VILVSREPEIIRLFFFANSGRKGIGYGDFDLVSGQEVDIEERSFVAKGAPLDDGQRRVGVGLED
jgi:hypothetical protein